MAFTTSGQETEWALFLQPRSPHGAVMVRHSDQWTWMKWLWQRWCVLSRSTVIRRRATWLAVGNFLKKSRDSRQARFLLLPSTITYILLLVWCHFLTDNFHPINNNSDSNKGDAVVLLVGRWTCDLQVVGLSHGWAPLCSGLGQATYSCVPVTKQYNG